MIITTRKASTKATAAKARIVLTKLHGSVSNVIAFPIEPGHFGLDKVAVIPVEDLISVCQSVIAQREAKPNAR